MEPDVSEEALSRILIEIANTPDEAMQGSHTCDYYCECHLILPALVREIRRLREELRYAE